MHSAALPIVREFISANFDTEGRQIDTDTPLLDDGLIDSGGLLEVVLFLEERFGVVVEDADVLPENFASVRRIAAFVERLGGARARGLAS